MSDLIVTYHDLNPATVDELDEEPSPLEFMRYVHRNRPFVIRNGAQDWPASRRWNSQYLKDVMARQSVNVAMTPYGNADSIISLSSGGYVFVKPFEREEPFEYVLEKIQEEELYPGSFSGPTRYAQTQNDNLRNEYTTLFTDVPPSVRFAQIALQQEPDAINFWLGNSKSVTALHKDNYENIYVQIVGKKHFVLLPPTESACVNEQSVLAATYAPRSQDSDQTVKNGEDLVVTIDEPEEYVPFAIWDPDLVNENTTPYSQYSQALRMTLNEGDMLYLPALWYHKVSQSCNEEGICCAINYWYDLDFTGGFWTAANFIRGVGLLSLQDKEKRTNIRDEQKTSKSRLITKENSV